MEKNNNTTKLVNALATLLPPLFLEARIFSGGKQLELVTQLGLSIPTTQNMDIAIFTRTSGAAFAVGIGSFVAYKMLCRLIKSNCIWTALEQLSQTEELKKEQKASNNETICENDLLKRLDEFLSSSSTTTTNKLEKGKQRIAVVQVRQANALKRLFRRSQHLNQTGIASIDQQLNFNEKFNKIDTIASRGDIFNYFNNNNKEEILNDYNDNNNKDIKSNLSNNNNNNYYCSSSSSNTFCSKQNFNNSSISSKSSNKTCKSVSIQINCENELFWEDEFSNNEEEEKRREEEIEEDFCDDEGLFLFREREGSLGSISQLSAMKNLEKMFCNDWLNKNINEEENEENINYNLLDNALNNLREMSSLDDVANTSSSYSSLHNYEQTKQLINYPKDESKPSFTAYKIVLQNELSESSSSLCGGSTRSDIFGRYCCPSSPHRQQRKILDNNKISTSQGLWELTNDGTNSRLMSEKQCLKIYESKDRNNLNGLMVDSIISINSSHASSSLGNSSLQIQMPNSDIMIDSAIGTDFQSSADDDDWVKEQQNMEEGEIIELGNILKKNGGIFRRFGGGEIEYNNNNNKGINLLNKINEQSNTTTPIKKIINSSLSNLSINESETSLEWF